MGKLRKIYRLLGLVFPVIYFAGDKNLVLITLLPLSFILLMVEILRFQFPQISDKYFQIFSLIAKKREAKTLLGTTYLVWGALATVLFFEKEIAILALLFLVLGDIASFYADKIGKIRLFSWGKTLEGRLGFFAVCFLMSLVLKSTSFINLSLFITLAGAIVATIAEALPLRIGRFWLDDNLTIPIFSALAMTLVVVLLNSS